MYTTSTMVKIYFVLRHLLIISEDIYGDYEVNFRINLNQDTLMQAVMV